MAFTIISRPPNDDFTFRLFYNLTKSYHQTASCIYLWSVHLSPKFFQGPDIYETDFRRRLHNAIEKDLVIIGIKDHLTDDNESPPLLVQYLIDMFSFFQNKKFVLFTSLENLGSYITNPNVKIIPWGGDITNQKFEYIKYVKPILEKNLDSEFNFINLNRGIRNHRLFSLSMIYGMELESRGLISCLFQESIPKDASNLKWDIREDLFKISTKGFEKIKKINFSIKEVDRNIYRAPNDNVNNFLDILSKYYKDTFVEIISETSFIEKSFLITEKTLNSIYGCNFPILLSPPGTVKFLRDLGLDMFDDIINHDYDNIQNNAERIYTALDQNKNLLTDKNIKHIWKSNRHRFINNVNFVKNDLFDYFKDRASTNFVNYMKEYYG